jgi:hypothetical protein
LKDNVGSTGTFRCGEGRTCAQFLHVLHVRFCRADEKYGWIRRIQLQDYLRAIVKLRVLRNESLSFWKFICMPKRVMFGPQTAEEIEREHARSMSSERPPPVAKTPGTTEKRPSLTLNPIDLLFPKSTVATEAEASSEEQSPIGVETATEEYDPEKDLESFNESLQLAAREAVLRGLYGPKSPKVDIDNVHNVRKSVDPQGSDGHSHASSGSATSPITGALKLNRVYDDNGDEIVTPTPQHATRDLSYLASSNAILNTRLTSRDEFAVPHSPGSGGVLSVNASAASPGGGFSSSGSSSMTGSIRAPPIHVVQANEALWSTSELSRALEALEGEEFDTAVHFSGPRSGPSSVSSTPNVSMVNGVDMNRSDLNIMPNALRARGVSEGTDSSAQGEGSSGKARDKLPAQPSAGNGEATSALPQPPNDSPRQRVSFYTTG